MYVIDGFSKKVITDITYHELDTGFVLIERQRQHVIGITVQIFYAIKVKVLFLKTSICLAIEFTTFLLNRNLFIIIIIIDNLYSPN